jgi:hypothetical protein
MAKLLARLLLFVVTNENKAGQEAVYCSVLVWDRGDGYPFRLSFTFVVFPFPLNQAELFKFHCRRLSKIVCKHSKKVKIMV